MRPTGINFRASEDLLRALGALGVRDVVACAGARNSPLIAVLEKTEGLQTHAFFEERSAAFFALGRARRDRQPVAVLTTSGTAAAELLPAVIEAFHTGVPLVLVTADRPRRLRGTGAPQAIDQVGLFKKFVAAEIDVEAGEPLALSAWDRSAPLHVNICFDEPLIAGPAYPLRVDSRWMSGPERAHESDGTSPLNQAAAEFLMRVRRPLAIVSALDSRDERRAVETFLAAMGGPVYLEATSGLRESPVLAPQALRSGDRCLSWALAQGHFDSVLRIGGVPTSRIWRDLDDPSFKIEVLSLSPRPFAGLSRGTLAVGDLKDLRAQGSHLFSEEMYAALFSRDREGAAALETWLDREPRSEPALVRALSRLVPLDPLMYVGNSLPIREWDLAAERARPCAVQANRGANGIDGQLSTFFGMIPDGGEGWCLVGDLTALYDLSAPWALRQARPIDSGTDSRERVRVVVLNNGGGKIFSRIFKSALFENRHALEFRGWALMWGLHYESWTEVPSRWEGPRQAVIELRPDEAATRRFWDEHDAFWEKA